MCAKKKEKTELKYKKNSVSVVADKKSARYVSLWEYCQSLKAQRAPKARHVPSLYSISLFFYSLWWSQRPDLPWYYARTEWDCTVVRWQFWHHIILRSFSRLCSRVHREITFRCPKCEKLSYITFCQAMHQLASTGYNTLWCGTARVLAFFPDLAGFYGSPLPQIPQAPVLFCWSCWFRSKSELCSTSLLLDTISTPALSRLRQVVRQQQELRSTLTCF